MKRIHVVFPKNLLEKIDKLAGSRSRSAFLAGLARRDIKRRHLMKGLNQDEPIWKDEDYPELQAGAAAWVRKMRVEAEARFERIQQQRDRH